MLYLNNPNSRLSLSNLEENDYETGILEEFGKGVSSGVDQLQGLIGGGGRALIGSAIGDDDLFYDGMRYFDEQMSEAAENAADVGSLEEIDGIGDFAKYSAFVVGNVIPSLIGGGGAGAVGGYAAKRLAMHQAGKALVKQSAGQLSKKQAATQYARSTVGQEALAKRGLRGQMGGAMLFGTAAGAGESFTRIFDETGEEAAVEAIITGVASGALDAMAPMRALQRILPQKTFRDATEEVAGNIAKNRPIYRRALSEAGKTGATEGVTEMMQEIVQNATLEVVRGYDAELEDSFLERMFDDAKLSQYANAFVAGTIGGAAMGGATGVLTRDPELRKSIVRQEQLPSPEDVDRSQAEAESAEQVEEQAPTEQPQETFEERRKAVRQKAQGLPQRRREIPTANPEETRGGLQQDIIDKALPQRRSSTPEEATVSRESIQASVQAQVDAMPAARDNAKRILKEVTQGQGRQGTYRNDGVGEKVTITPPDGPVSTTEVSGALPDPAAITPPMKDLVGQDVEYNGNKGLLIEKEDGFYVATQDNGDVFIESGENKTATELGVVPSAQGLQFENDFQIDPETKKFTLRGKEYTLARIIKDQDGNPLSLAVRDAKGKRKSIKEKSVLNRVQAQMTPAPDFSKIEVEMDDLPASIQRKLIEQSDQENIPDQVPAQDAISIAESLPNADNLIESVKEAASFRAVPLDRDLYTPQEYTQTIRRPDNEVLSEAIVKINNSQADNRTDIDEAKIDSLLTGEKIPYKDGKSFVSVTEASKTNPSFMGEVKAAIIDLFDAGMPKSFVSNIKGLYVHGNLFDQTTNAVYSESGEFLSLYSSLLSKVSRDKDNNTNAASLLRFALAHEMGHAFDVRTSHSQNAPEFRIEVEAVESDSVTFDLGPIIAELAQNFDQGTDLGLEMAYPFAIAFDSFNENQLASLAVIQKEAFAQAFAVFHASPEILEQQAPLTYNYMKQLLQSEKIDNGQSNILSTQNDTETSGVRRDVRSQARTGSVQVPDSSGDRGDGRRGPVAEEARQGLGQQADNSDGRDTGRPVQVAKNDRQQLMGMARARSPKLIASAVAGKGRGLAFPDDTPIETLIQYNQDVMAAIVDDGGQIPILRELGIPHEIAESAGSYTGYEPSIIIRLLGGTMQTADKLAPLIGDALLQDAVITSQVVYGKEGLPSFMIRKTDRSEFTRKEAMALAERVNPEKNPDGLNFNQPMADTLTFLDPRSLGDDAYTDSQAKEFAGILINTLGDEYTMSVATTEGNYHGSDQYREAIERAWNPDGAEGRPDIYDRTNDSLYEPVRKVYNEYAEKLGIPKREAQDLDFLNAPPSSAETERPELTDDSRELPPVFDAETEGSPEWEAAVAKGLDMSKEARLKRAKEMGFDTSTVYYHGTPSGGFSEFDPYEVGNNTSNVSNGHYFTDDRSIAETYSPSKKDIEIQQNIGFLDDDGYEILLEPTAGIYPVYLKIENPLHLDFGGRSWDGSDEDESFGMSIPEAENMAVQGGYDALIVDNVIDEGEYGQGYSLGAKTINVFNPKNIRSVNAAFDPAMSESSNLLFAPPSRPDSTYSEVNEARNAAIRDEKKTVDKAAGWIKKTFKRQLTSRGLLNEQVFQAKMARDGEFGAAEIDTRMYLNSYDKAVKDANLSEEQTALLSEAIATPLNQLNQLNLPAAVKQAVGGMRKYLDKMSIDYAQVVADQALQLAQSGKGEAAAAKVDLLNTIASNKGKYLNRSYQVFDDPKWANKVPKPVIDNARTFLESNGAQNADRIINTILKTGTAFDGLSSFISEGKLGSKDLSILKKRKDIAPEILALMGEYTDPRINFVKTSTKLSRLLWNHRFLERVKFEGERDGFLFTAEDAPTEAYVQIAPDSSDAMNPLNGLYTTPELAQGFEDAMDLGSNVAWVQKWQQINSVVKYGKTVVAPTTVARNFMSASLFTVANGHFNWAKAGVSLRSLDGYFSSKEGDATAYLREIRRLGVVYDSPYARELTKALEDFSKGTELDNKVRAVDGLKDKAVQKSKGFLDFMAKNYQYGDDFWKIIGFENMVDVLMENKGMTREQAMPLAAERIRDTYPTYSLIGKGVRELRRFPLVGTFVSFPAEIVRTSFNMFKYLKQDMADPDMRDHAMAKVAGMSAVSFGIYALQDAAMRAFDVDEEEQEAIRLMSPTWSENSNILPTGRDEDGNLEYIDLTYLDPYAYFKKPINALMRDQPTEDAVVQAGLELLTPFLGVDIATGTVLELYNNEKVSGGRIWNPADTPANKLSAATGHLIKGAGPAIIQNIKRTSKAIDGDVSTSGKRYELEDELKAWVGFRVTTFDPKISLHFKAYEFNEDKRNATSLLTTTFRDPNQLDEGELENAFERASKARQEGYERMIKLVGAARSAGLNKTQLMMVLRSNGVSKKDARALVAGNPATWEMSDSTLKNSITKSDLLFGESTSREFQDRWKVIEQMLREETQ